MSKKLTRAKLLLGHVADMSNLRYITGFSAPDAVIFLDTGKKRYLAVSPLEYGRAIRQAKNVEVISFETFKRPKNRRPTVVGWAVELIKQHHIREVQVSDSFPLIAAKKLSKAGIRVKVAEGPFFKKRAIKRAEELACIREVQQAAVIAYRAAARKIAAASIDEKGHLRDGTKCLDAECIRRIIDIALIERDCIAKDTIVACGNDAADPHEMGSGPLMAGQTIVIDKYNVSLKSVDIKRN